MRSDLNPSQPTVAMGSVVPGIDFLRITNTMLRYHGMKAHYGVGLTCAGHSTANVDGVEAEQQPGTLQLKEPGQVHRDLHRHTPGTFQLLSFDADLVASARAAAGTPASARLSTIQLAPGDPRGDALRRLHRLSREATDAFTMDAALAEALACFVSFLDGSVEAHAAAVSRLSVQVMRARAFLVENYAERVDLDALAETVGADKFHLCRAFTKDVGMPPYKFLTHLRIAKARSLLRRGVRPTDVAPLTGFCDQSQMHRHFVKIVGFTPGEYARA
jgi:AraC-like DNA-binding protein